MQGWKCLFCPSTFGTYGGLTDHLSAEHREEMADMRAAILGTLEAAARIEALERWRREIECRNAVEAAFAARRN